MAYAWTAVYGYYIEDTTQQGVADLTNKYTTDSGFHISTPSTLFTLPESLELPSPINSHSYVRKETASSRVHTLTEYNYTTLLPFISSDGSSGPITYANVLKWISSVEKVFPWAFIYNRAQIEDAFYIRNYTRCLFVWLTDINIIIDQNGTIFSVNPETQKITKIASGGFNFQFIAQFTQQNIQPTFINNDGYVYVSFRYAGSWYRNYIFSRNREELTAGTEYEEYNVWYDSNRASSIQNQINNAIIGTESNPKYKYKTDPANPDTDPYTPPFPPSPGKPGDPGNPSGPGGGGGTMVIPPSDPTPIPGIGSLPNITTLGLVNVYNPSSAEIIALATELWHLATNFTDEIKKIITSPMEAILSLHCIPVTPTDGSALPIQLGNYRATATSPNVMHQYIEFDCGSVTLDEIWGSYLDYKCRVTVFLPFIGMVPLDPDDVIGQTINIKYVVDAVTGSCVAYIVREDVVIGTFAGNCAYQMPLTGADHTQLVTGLAGMAAGAITGVATGGMSAPIAAGMAASSINVAMSKTQYQKAGGLGANTAFMGIRVPFVTVHVPKQCVPTNQNKYKGYPSYMTKRIGDLSGYTEVEAIHLDMIPATPAELDEIRRILAEGVIL